jgi:hypothetical protein
MSAALTGGNRRIVFFCPTQSHAGCKARARQRSGNVSSSNEYTPSGADRVLGTQQSTGASHESRTRLRDARHCTLPTNRCSARWEVTPRAGSPPYDGPQGQSQPPAWCSGPGCGRLQQQNSRVGDAAARAVSRQTGAPRLRPSARGGYDQHIGNGGMLATLQSRTVIQSRMDPASHGSPTLDPISTSSGVESRHAALPSDNGATVSIGTRQWRAGTEPKISGNGRLQPRRMFPPSQILGRGMCVVATVACLAEVALGLDVDSLFPVHSTIGPQVQLECAPANPLADSRACHFSSSGAGFSS